MKTSIIVPARNEPFLDATVRDLLAKAEGSIEIIVVADGYWPAEAATWDKRVKILHRGSALGMRPAINAAAAIATGDCLMKCDAHTMWDQGYDVKLRVDYLEGNWILTPRRYALDADNWALDESNPKYPVDYEYLSNPFERPDDPTCGLHGTEWRARREARKDKLLDEDMSSQGSAWFMTKKHFETLSPLNLDLFGNFYGESQEIGLQTQLRGGAMMRTKKTWYAHLRKGKKHGRGYALGPSGHRNGAAAMLRRCLLNQWPGQTKTVQEVVERFMPVPGWPADLDRLFAEARERTAA